ncbi:MSHA biogenesis protein MshC [Rugamonas rivuli]|uniref:MSHA biogenesis protein MshC n=1 Tax=Rugamonas rivuli TaxID=2743358 RepID=A0A843S449_9BURK|nr:MSHA biogenesis protein MshC [Rugamonas rivuli]MQA18889.1 MSHA biogenesis protein MshC [Rugamonas rivuli]
MIVVLGILGAIAAPRFFDTKGFDAASFTDQLKAQIRYGQKAAIAQGRYVFVRLNGSSVALCYDAGCNSRVAPPGGANSGTASTVTNCGAAPWACEGVPNGLALSAVPSFYFDPNGQPFALADPVGSVVSTFATQTLAVSGDGATHNVTVTAVTGYVF